MSLPQESEWKTRKQRIDPKLKALGWELVPYDPSKPLASYHKHAIEEYPTEKLTQSVLEKAFQGELVPTEAELARKEGRD